MSYAAPDPRQARTAAQPSLDPIAAIGEAFDRMKALINFVLNMDAKAWRSVAVSFERTSGLSPLDARE